LAVFFQGHGEDQNVVQIYSNLSYGDEISEDGVHEGLERSGGIGEPKEHNVGCKEASVGGDSSLLLVLISNPYVVVTPSNVELREILGTFESTNDVCNEGEGVSILDGNLVESSVVLDEAEFSILLLDKEDGGCIG
jgi:hypothetical protein